jgi:hypothetical protein
MIPWIWWVRACVRMCLGVRAVKRDLSITRFGILDYVFEVRFNVEEEKLINN